MASTILESNVKANVQQWMKQAGRVAFGLASPLATLLPALHPLLAVLVSPMVKHDKSAYFPSCFYADDADCRTRIRRLQPLVAHG
jgi:hypothetical protein